MRIMLVTSAPFPPREGLGYHIWNLAQQLVRGGNTVGIITRGGAARTTEEQHDGITIWRLPFVPAYPVHVHLHGLFVNRFFAGIENRFDLVNAHTPLPPVIRTSLPMVTTVHSPMQADTAATQAAGLHGVLVRLQTPVSRGIESELFRRSRRITVVARWVADALAAYGVNPSRVTVTGNGVEAGFLSADATSERRSFALSVGRLEPGKGIEDLIEAARIFVSRCPDSAMRFIVVGSGSLHAALQAQVERAGLAARFEFRGQIAAGRREELAALYRTAGIFVLPSHHEGMPTVLLEAMASGAPVISTAVGGALEVVTSGQNGLLVAPRAPEALAEALMALNDDETLRGDLGRKARATVEQRYSWDAVAKQYVACYEQVMDGKG